MLAVIAGLAGVLCYSFRERPRRFALGLGGIILAGIWFSPGPVQQTLFTSATFSASSGSSQVEEAGTAVSISSTHGSTLHGGQMPGPGAAQGSPFLLFQRSGPLGQIFAAYYHAIPGGRWALSGWAPAPSRPMPSPGQHFTYYEIDPAVEQVARDRRYFTYLADCRAKVDVVLGDARLSLKEAPPAHYDLFILDAFSSDAIPIHLITQEALGLYLSKLKEGGLMAFHISNRYLDLKPVLGNLAQEAGLTCLVQDYNKVTAAEKKELKCGSSWVVMARRPQDLAPLAADPRWRELPGNGAPLWTDDFSNILTVFNWHPLRLSGLPRGPVGKQISGSRRSLRPHPKLLRNDGVNQS